MDRSEILEFAKYEIYYFIEEEKITLCICENGDIATSIAKSLALHTKEPNERIYLTGIYEPGALVPGGGWYDVYWRDEEGNLKSSGLG